MINRNLNELLNELYEASQWEQRAQIRVHEAKRNIELLVEDLRQRVREQVEAKPWEVRKDKP